MMDNNNNNNMMELNTEETQKKREKQEKIDNIKKKIKDIKEKFQENKEDRKRAKEEKERVKEEERRMKEQEKAPSSTIDSFKSSSYETTVTNETIRKSKNTKRELTPQEKRQKKRKRQKLIRNIMTIPEIIFVIFLALFLKNKYIDYSNNVHQILNYAAEQYIYEIRRDNDIIKVSKNVQQTCEEEPCTLKKEADYEIKFSKNQMTIIRVFMDIEFFFKSTTKTITVEDLKTELGKRSIFSMIHNNAQFLSTNSYKKYNIVDYEQMSDYTTRGYKYVTTGEKPNLYIAMGERPTSGYALVINQVYKKGDTVYFYILEQKPSTEDTYLSLVTHPMVHLELDEKPQKILVYNIETGEEYKDLDAPSEVPQEPAQENDKGVSGILGEMQTNLNDVLK